MTEALVSSTFEEDLSLASTGRLVPNTTAKVIDPETSEVLGYNDVSQRLEWSFIYLSFILLSFIYLTEILYYQQTVHLKR